MNYVDACRLYSSRKPVHASGKMLEWLKAGLGFAHIRFNDGEMNSLLRLYKPEERNNCGHHYFLDLGDALLRMMREMKEAKPDRLLLGSYWHTQSEDISRLDQPCRAFVEWIIKEEMLDLPWVGSDDLVEGLMDGSTLPLFDEIRGQAEQGRRSILVGNPRIAPGAKCLGAEFVQIPRIDCWRYTTQLMATMRGVLLNHPNAAVTWCCGMSKPWIFDLWREFPNSCHLDAGHLFDAAVGEMNRAYSRRRNRAEEKWRCYEDFFLPYYTRFQ